MILSGAKVLEINRSKVDSLNVFPVPDGDTGTNMSLTMQSAVKELSVCSVQLVCMEICDCRFQGRLEGGARKFGRYSFPDFAGYLFGIQRMRQGDSTHRTFSQRRWRAGTKVAYGAVSVPKEGTMLTVVRMMSEHSRQGRFENRKILRTFSTDVIAEGEKALAMTPELLARAEKSGRRRQRAAWGS